MKKYSILATPPASVGTVLEHVDALRGRAMTLERNPWDAGDLVHDTLERAMRHQISIPAGAAMRSWLMRVMFNLFIDRCRKRSREVGMDPIDAVEVAAPAPYQPCAWEDISNDEVSHAMARLEPPFSDVLRLRHQEGRSYREISQMLDIPEATVGTRLLRARRKVRRILQPQEKSVAASMA